MLFWPLFLSTMTFKPLFRQITILSLSLVNFRVSRFRVSHLTHETFKLYLQNTLNMLKMKMVYFGVLHIDLHVLLGMCVLLCEHSIACVLRWGVTLIGVYSTRFCSLRCGTPFQVVQAADPHPRPQA